MRDVVLVLSLCADELLFRRQMMTNPSRLLSQGSLVCLKTAFNDWCSLLPIRALSKKQGAC